MNPLNLIQDKYLLLVKLSAIALAVVLALVWWNSHNRTQQRIGYDRATAEFRTAQEKAAAAQRVREAGNFRKQERAIDERSETERQLAAARAAARAADERLRNTRADFDRRLDAATRETALVAARTAAELLGECGERYRAVAFAADGHLADARLCRAAWPE